MKISHKSLSNERERSKTGTFTRTPTVGKVIRDAKTMKDLASYVIELDDKGNVKNHYSNPPFEQLLDCIVVLAPAKFQEVHVEQAVVLEIGLSRFVPYKATEIKAVRPDNKKQCRVIPCRQQLDILPWKVIQKILPTIWTAIQFCVDAKMERWTKAKFVQKLNVEKQRLGTKRLVEYEAWITIRIPKEYALIYAVLRLKDESNKLQPNKNYAIVAETTRLEFDFFRKLNPLSAGSYSDEIIEKSTTLNNFAQWIRRKIEAHGYTSRSIEALRKLLNEEDPKDLSLFDKVYRVFRLPKAPPDIFLNTYELELGSQKNKLLAECTLNPCLVNKREKRRTIQAKDCFSIAVIGEKENMKRLDIRNTSNRLKLTKLKEGEVAVEQDEQDSDIPF